MLYLGMEKPKGYNERVKIGLAAMSHNDSLYLQWSIDHPDLPYHKDNGKATKDIKAKVPAECQLQSKCFVDHWNYYPAERGRFATITNNSENAIKGAMNKAMGVLEGVSDTFYLLPDGLIIWIEFKKQRTGKQSEAQKKWQATIEKLGHKYVIVDNYNDFWKVIGLRNPNDIPKLF